MNLREALERALSTDVLRIAATSAYAARSPPASFDLIAVGKGASATVDAMLDGWGSALAAGLAVLPDGAAPPRPHPRLRVLYASHPLPDSRSVVAGRDALTLAREGEGSELHVHVSGGASSLVATPIDGLTLADLQSVTRTLLLAGADVRAINAVRRHISQSHGGGLARAAWPRPTITGIVSDVIEGTPWDVGSGPASADPTTVADARRVLERYAPSFVGLSLAESLKPDDREAALVTARTWLEPQTFADVVREELTRERLAPRLVAPTTADVVSLAAEYVALARSLAPGEAVVRSAEPSVRIRVPEPGKGGRCCHLAALVSRDLPSDVELLAAASDGVDGSSGTGGALVTARSFRRYGKDLDDAISTFATGPFHQAHATALPSRATGLNFADVHVLARSAT